MRLQKLRDFLLFYKEADLWAEYRNRNISELAADVKAYEAGMTAARAAELKQYADLKRFFLTKDVGGLYARYQPFEQEALALIQKNHDVFIASWPKEIRGERTFLLFELLLHDNGHENVHDLSQLFQILPEPSDLSEELLVIDRI